MGTFTGRLGPSPVDTITATTGQWGMRLIIATLAISQLSRISGWNKLITFRKLFGLFAFLYVVLHAVTFFGLDYLFSFHLILADVRSTPHVIVGFLAFLLLIPLAVTSSARWKKRLRQQRWQKLHFLIYLAGIGAVLHYFLQVKAVPVDLVVYAALVAVLLGYRLVRVAIFFRKNSIHSEVDI